MGGKLAGKLQLNQPLDRIIILLKVLEGVRGNFLKEVSPKKKLSFPEETNQNTGRNENMKKLLIFLGIVTAALAALAVLMPVEVTEDGDYIVMGRRIGKKKRRGRGRVICTDTPLGILIDKIRACREDTNVDCTECTDCMNCDSCVDCEECSDCVGCEECSDCMDCVDCLGCENCNDCVDCVDCIDCDRCTGCIGLIGVTGAKDRSDFRFYDSDND